MTPSPEQRERGADQHDAEARFTPAEDGVLEYDREAEWRGQRTIPFFPDHAISEVTAAILVLCLLSVLCILLPATLGLRANPVLTPEGSKPAWYFLFLHQLLRVVPPTIGALTPVLLLVAAGALPFLDRNPSRSPRARVFALTVGAGVLLVVVVLTVAGWMR